MPDATSKPGVIYLARNKITGMLYVGQTTVPLRIRLRNHFAEAIKRKSRSAFHAAIVDYGKDAFAFEVIQVCCGRACLNAAECWWIAHLKCLVPHGYNLTPGGQGWIPGESTRQKMSAWQLGLKRPNWTPWMKGKKHSEESRRAISEANRRLMTPERLLQMTKTTKARTTPEHIAKMHAGNRIKSAERKARGEKNANLLRPANREKFIQYLLQTKGRPKSSEHRAKIAASHQGKPKPWLLGKKHSDERCKKIADGVRLACARKRAEAA